MLRLRSTLTILFFISLQTLNAREVTPTSASDVSTAADVRVGLSYTDALILGLVEGVTEYLPISSTGHLIITNAWLGLDGDQAMLDAQGEPILVNTDEGFQRPYTIGEAAYAYVIVIQAGAIAAILLLYWSDLWSILMGCLGKDHKGRKLGINLIAAFLPAAVIGLLLDDWIEAKLGNNIHAVAGALIVGAIVMLAVERWRKNGNRGAIPTGEGPGLDDLTIGKSVMIGFFQCFAMWPGTSRSMTTIIGGYLVGLSPAHAAQFSFLLGLITLTAASGYKLVSDGGNMLAALQVGPVILGCVVAFVSAALAVKWFVGYLGRHGLSLFAWYRIALAIAVFAIAA